MNVMLSMPLVVAAVWTPPLAAQISCAQGYDAKMYYYNSTIGGSVSYSNEQSPGGTAAGDAVWKVFPSELFLRTFPVEVGLTDLRGVWRVDNFTPTQATVVVQRAELRWVTRDAQGNLIPDFVRPPFYFTRSPYLESVPAAGDFQIQINTDWQRMIGPFDPRTEPGIAAVLYGPVGNTPTSPNRALMAHSAGERYGKAPQASFSGVRNGMTGAVSLLVPPTVPYAAEIQIAVGQVDAVVQPSATSASSIGGQNETYQGIGAYYNDLASRGGQLRLYVEDDAANYAPNRPIYGCPLFSAGRGSISYPLPNLSCRIAENPQSPLTTLPLTWGWASQYVVRDPHTTFADAFLFTPWLSIPQAAELIGTRLCFEVLTVSLIPGVERIGGVSNSIELLLQ